MQMDYFIHDMHALHVHHPSTQAHVYDANDEIELGTHDINK